MNKSWIFEKVEKVEEKKYKPNCPERAKHIDIWISVGPSSGISIAEKNWEIEKKKKEGALEK